MEDERIFFANHMLSSLVTSYPPVGRSHESISVFVPTAPRARERPLDPQGFPSIRLVDVCFPDSFVCRETAAQSRHPAPEARSKQGRVRCAQVPPNALVDEVRCQGCAPRLALVGGASRKIGYTRRLFIARPADIAVFLTNQRAALGGAHRASRVHTRLHPRMMQIRAGVTVFV